MDINLLFQKLYLIINLKNEGDSYQATTFYKEIINDFKKLDNKFRPALLNTILDTSKCLNDYEQIKNLISIYRDIKSESIEKELYILYLQMHYFLRKNTFDQALEIFEQFICKNNIDKLSVKNSIMFLKIILLTGKNYNKLVEEIENIIAQNKDLDTNNLRLQVCKYYSNFSDNKNLEKNIHELINISEKKEKDINKLFKVYFRIFDFGVKSFENNSSTKIIDIIHEKIKNNISDISLDTEIIFNSKIILTKYDILVSNYMNDYLTNEDKDLILNQVSNIKKNRLEYSDLYENYHVLTKFYIDKNRYNEARKIFNKRFENKDDLITEDLQNELALEYRGLNTKRFGITAFVTTKDEFKFIPAFLSYYRNLGVEQFIFIDNNSSDQTCEYLKKQSDVVLYTTNNDFAKARAGTDWVQFLMKFWSKNSWCLFVDPDEFIVFPLMNNYGLRGLVKYMDSRNFECMRVFHLDVFKLDKFVKKFSLNHLMRFYNSQDVYFYNDYCFTNSWNPTFFTLKGGIRRKVYEEISTLDKNTIFRNKPNINLWPNTHSISSFKPCDVTGTLIHKKLLKSNNEFSKKVKDPDYKLPSHCTIRQARYINAINKDLLFNRFKFDKKIVKYKSSNQLIKLGLIKSSLEYEKFIKKL